MSLRAFQLVSCAGVLLLGARGVDAQVLKCKDSAGHVTYTQATCPAGTQPLDSSQVATSAATGSESAGRPRPAHPADADEKCPATLAREGSDADVRACSSAHSFPSTTQWAQVSQHIQEIGGYRQWNGDYICLRFIAKLNATGERVQMRPYLTVSDAMRAGARIPGYQSASVPNQVFPTKVAAVEAGCAAAKSE